MIATEIKKQNDSIKEESSKLELYRLLGEGYKAVEEGRTSPIEDVIERFEQRRASK
jgi:hypothetical protein